MKRIAWWILSVILTVVFVTGCGTIHLGKLGGDW